MMGLFGKFKNALGSGLTSAKNGLAGLGNVAKKAGETLGNVGKSIADAAKHIAEHIIPSRVRPKPPAEQDTVADQAKREQDFANAFQEYLEAQERENALANGAIKPVESPDSGGSTFSPGSDPSNRTGDSVLNKETGFPLTPKFYFDDDVETWLATGKMKIASFSNNVYGFFYDRKNQALYIQFLHWQPGMNHMHNSGPGATYRYDNVSENKARDLFNNWELAGEWVWDYLRVRQTWSCHQHPYSLVRIANEYVPRKAVIDNSARYGESFVPREFEQDGETYYSELEERDAHLLSMYTKIRERWRKFHYEPFGFRGHPEPDD